MKRVLQKLWQVIRYPIGVWFAICALGGVLAFFETPEPLIVVAAFAFSTVAYLLLRRKKPKEPGEPKEPPKLKEVQSHGSYYPGVSVRTEVTPPEVPKEILREMRKYYTSIQAQNDARILRESFQICQQTYNFETFFNRLQLTQRCALTLMQAKQAGAKSTNRL